MDNKCFLQTGASDCPAPVQGDASEGYALLLRLVGEELAQDLPGLFGSDGVAALVPVPAGTLRHAVEVLDQPGLASPGATC